MSTDHRPFSAQDLCSFLDGLDGLSARLANGKPLLLGLRWFCEDEDAEHGETPENGELILEPLEEELASALVGEEGVTADGFLGWGFAMHLMLVGIPIGGGDVTLGLGHGDAEQAEVVLENSKHRGVKGLAPPCLGVLGLGGLEIKGVVLLRTRGGEQIRVKGEDEGDCTREFGAEDRNGRAILL